MHAQRGLGFRRRAPGALWLPWPCLLFIVRLVEARVIAYLRKGFQLTEFSLCNSILNASSLFGIGDL